MYMVFKFLATSLWNLERVLNIWLRAKQREKRKKKHAYNGGKNFHLTTIKE